MNAALVSVAPPACYLAGTVYLLLLPGGTGVPGPPEKINEPQSAPAGFTPQKPVGHLPMACVPHRSWQTRSGNSKPDLGLRAVRSILCVLCKHRVYGSSEADEFGDVAGAAAVAKLT